MVKASKPKRQRGRPPVGATTMQQIAIRLPKPMLSVIDEIVSGRLDQPERSAIIRELIAEALAARGGRKK
jgi:metal-responsive CopG/Arc/MetJ family transcriptional regulator